MFCPNTSKFLDTCKIFSLKFINIFLKDGLKNVFDNAIISTMKLTENIKNDCCSIL
jgi:hypothetical protein